MEITAHLNYLRISPRKVRLVANLIKGMSINGAELELRHLSKRSSLPLLKLLKSAVANAKHNFQLSDDGLYVKDIVVNSGTVLKRFTPRAFGRASSIHKRTSHVSLVLDSRTASDKPRKSAKKQGPQVRDITPEDIQEGFTGGHKEERGSERERPGKAKSAGFVRKVFQRKAI